jgi:hypothetical protein
MIRLDSYLACEMACAGLPEERLIEVHLEKESTCLAFSPPTVPGRTSR